jgi:4-hydroxy-tetrahydrodipicolinate synthase
MMQDALYGGVNAAVLTPMHDDLSPDLPRMAAHCRWLLANGCNGLGILGTTGEATSFSVAERIAIMESVVGAGVPATKLLPGAGCAALTDSVELTRGAARLGCPGVLVLPPFYYKNPSDDGLFAYFSELVQRTGGETKIYLYHFPQQSAVPFSHDLIGRLLRAFPGVIKGVKDSSGDFENMREMAKLVAAEGFEVYSGSDEFLTRMLAAGGAGCITAASNVNSRYGARVFAAPGTPNGDAAQAVMSAVRKAVTSVPLIPGLRSLVARHTVHEGWKVIRPPHLALAPQQEQALFAAFDATGAELGEVAKLAA